MAKEKFPVTTAIRALRQHKVDFDSHLYNYEEKGGTAVSARELGVDEHAVIKTLVMENENRHPCMVLMHGDRQVSTSSLPVSQPTSRSNPAHRNWRCAIPDIRLVARRHSVRAQNLRFMRKSQYST